MWLLTSFVLEDYARRGSNAILVHKHFCQVAWVINPLVAGLGTRPEKPRFAECLVLPYIVTWFSSVCLVPGRCPKSGRWKQMFTLLDVRPENHFVVMTISTISMFQNGSISFSAALDIFPPIWTPSGIICDMWSGSVRNPQPTQRTSTPTAVV